ncbi:hypothetical protein [Polyangium jinanense]|uniref:Uncharacterized protein n=1 Tax=Polyangium jinanense TaxID=2829994 RepID=A0A9X4AVR3_9BACT|nr:hypothetical protein [Polyangium jinanense]MDC3957611.1 hypothetical protein [Polyangium jinanense]MDC3984607.1 hypothetical protein [Polyangium jinanense]
MPRAPGFPLLVFLAACASPPPPPAPPPLVAIPPPPAAAPPAPPDPPPPEKPLPPPVALDAPVACAFEAAQWSGAADVTNLALLPDATPFARIRGGAARLSIPVGPVGDTLLRIRDQGVTVEGHTPASASVLRANVPIVMNGFAIPTIFAHLGWSTAEGQSLTVTHPDAEELEVLDPPLRATRPCGDVGLEGDSFSAEDAVPGGGEAKRKEVKIILPGSPVPLSLEPKGKPVARITLSTATHVSVFESRGGMSRISLPVDTLYVFGWVKTSDLKPSRSLTGYGSGGGRGGIRHPPFVVKERLRCEHDVPLVAEAGGERRTVGSIGKNTTLEILDRTKDEARVRVWTRVIHMAESTSFLVRSVDISGCSRIDG